MLTFLSYIVLECYAFRILGYPGYLICRCFWALSLTAFRVIYDVGFHDYSFLEIQGFLGMYSTFG